MSARVDAGLSAQNAVNKKEKNVTTQVVSNDFPAAMSVKKLALDLRRFGQENLASGLRYVLVRMRKSRVTRR